MPVYSPRPRRCTVFFSIMDCTVSAVHQPGGYRQGARAGCWGRAAAGTPPPPGSWGGWRSPPGSGHLGHPGRDAEQPRVAPAETQWPRDTFFMQHCLDSITFYNYFKYEFTICCWYWCKDSFWVSLWWMLSSPRCHGPALNTALSISRLAVRTVTALLLSLIRSLSHSLDTWRTAHLAITSTRGAHGYHLELFLQWMNEWLKW